MVWRLKLVFKNFHGGLDGRNKCEKMSGKERTAISCPWSDYPNDHRRPSMKTRDTKVLEAVAWLNACKREVLCTCCVTRSNTRGGLRTPTVELGQVACPEGCAHWFLRLIALNCAFLQLCSAGIMRGAGRVYRHVFVTFVT